MKIISPGDTSRDSKLVAVNGHLLRVAAQYILEYGEAMAAGGFRTAQYSANTIARALLSATDSEASVLDGIATYPLPGFDLGAGWKCVLEEWLEKREKS